jgi:hypothetical protein
MDILLFHIRLSVTALRCRDDRDEGDMLEDSPPRIGVVLEAFTGRPLDEVLGWLRRAAPEVTGIEVGAGGYAPHPHCDVARLLASAAARDAWLDQIHRHGLRVDGLLDRRWPNPAEQMPWTFAVPGRGHDASQEVAA